MSMSNFLVFIELFLGVVLLYGFISEKIQKENVDCLLRLRSFQVSPNTYNIHIRVKAHAIGVSIRAFTLGCSFLILAKFGKNKNLSGRFCLYV